ncbi:hypothetical protein Q8A67_018627 [Cirrhinus molitorella]|uniref:Uncharacterized protein n=1 Tax=Cirrhinus molitorella TaxID=172907 RepID=A0AA88PGF1_9TELE|nr:hypothetical protein Q8A67_018627 [Cirrhinus molitorella]
MEFAARFIALAQRSQDLEDFVRDFSYFATTTTFDNETLKSLFWIGANSHHSVDLPDTTGLNWRKVNVTDRDRKLVHKAEKMEFISFEFVHYVEVSPIKENLIGPFTLRSANLQPSRTRLVAEKSKVQSSKEKQKVFSIGLWRSFEQGQVADPGAHPTWCAPLIAARPGRTPGEMEDER